MPPLTVKVGNEILELSLTYTKVGDCDRGLDVSKTENAMAYLKGAFDKDPQREHLIAIFVDGRGYAIARQRVFTGGFHSVPHRENVILRSALLAGASGVIVAHNHPSGVVTPSPSDIDNSAKLLAACNAVGLKLHDEIITDSRADRYVSFADKGYIPTVRRDKVFSDADITDRIRSATV